MKVQLKSNGHEIEIKKVDFDKFSDDQKRNYIILNKEDATPAVEKTTSNTKEVKKAEEPEKK